MKTPNPNLARPLDLKSYSSDFSVKQKTTRFLWNTVYHLLFRPSPIPFHGWRCFLLRLFGSKIRAHVHIYPTVHVWAPWNLKMDEGSSLAPGVDCYCVDKVEIGSWAMISQRSFICTAEHDIRSRTFDLKTSPITIGANAWVAAEAFIGPGVTIGEGAVVGARACVTKNVNPWTVVAGNPARTLGKRTVRKESR